MKISAMVANFSVFAISQLFYMSHTETRGSPPFRLIFGNSHNTRSQDKHVQKTNIQGQKTFDTINKIRSNQKTKYKTAPSNYIGVLSHCQMTRSDRN